MEKKPVYNIAAKQRGPGPGAYALPPTCGYYDHDTRKIRFPAYSFGGKLKDHNGTYASNSSPGPVYLVHAAVTRHGRDGTPKYSIVGRQNDLAVFRTPSPGRYRPEQVHPQGERCAPTYSMSTRTRCRRKGSNPAPSRYYLPPLLGSNQPNKLSSPSYSMKKYTPVGSYAEDLSQTPGPGQYDAVHPDRIHLRKPQYSLQGRSWIPCDKTNMPGPGAYRPEAVFINKEQAPKHSLGIRHSEFVTPVMIG